MKCFPHTWANVFDTFRMMTVGKVCLDCNKRNLKVVEFDGSHKRMDELRYRYLLVVNGETRLWK